MNYLMYNIIKFKESIDCDNLNHRCRRRKKDFSRNLKLTPKNLILYTQESDINQSILAMIIELQK